MANKVRNAPTIREYLGNLVRFHRTMAAVYFEDADRHARHTDEMNKAIKRLRELDESDA